MLKHTSVSSETEPFHLVQSYQGRLPEPHTVSFPPVTFPSPSMMMFAYKTNGMVGIQDMIPLNTKRYQIYPLFCRVSETDKASQGHVLSYQDTYHVTDLV